MDRLRQVIAASCVLASFAALAACAPGPKAALARVNGHAITEADVSAALGGTLAKLEEQIYELRRQQLETLIVEQLLAEEATKRGVSVDALIAREVTAKAGAVSDAEVGAFVAANEARLRGDPVSMQPQIRAHLKSQKTNARRNVFVQTLRAEAKIEMMLEAPPVYRARVGTEGFPARGSATAPVTIVEFSDFHCPYCRQTQPVLTEVLAKYGDKVRLVYRDFPLDSLHPDARTAAEAARCARDQGKFWQYHDGLFGGSPDGSATGLMALAGGLGLDSAAFERCFSSGKHRQGVQKDIEEGTRLGVTATPTFFVNGRVVVGGQPLEAFVRLVDQELAHQ